ncbi:hypothetical protein M9H77_22792 [Catharanthus roseus]|uniref:Uncharacterized protein n=1 Tax=Catharanthus roseus TaxID=4058 RepID=A0ACC0ASE5_CATRO|nr:hypothetical protein M9H77_22792 [Catharanthus roseus]
MVQPEVRRGDDALSLLTDRTGRVEGRTVTASSRGVRRRHSTSDIPSTSIPIGPDMYYDPGDLSSYHITPSVYPPYPMTFMDILSHHKHHMIHIPEKSRPPTNPTQRKKPKNDGWEQTGLADGGPQDPVLVPSYSGHVIGSIWRGHDIGTLKSRSRYVSLTYWTPSDLASCTSDLDITDSSISINGQDLAVVNESHCSGLSTYSLFTDKSGNNVPRKLWPLVKNVSSVGGFAWGLDILVFSYVCTSGETGSEVVGILVGGTISSAYVYMDQYTCYTSISDLESRQATPFHAIADNYSYYTACFIRYDSS